MVKTKSKAQQGKERNMKKIEENFEIMGEYKTVLDPLKVKCKTCDNIINKVARTYIRTGCPACNEIKREKQRLKRYKDEDDEYLERINLERVNLGGKGEYIITKYRKNRDDKVEIKHIPCGTVSVVEHKGAKVVCNICNPENLIDADWYREKYAEMVKEGYQVKDVIYGDYSESRSRPTNILIRHNECGNEYTRSRMTLEGEKGYLCPFCIEGRTFYQLNDLVVDERVKESLGDDYEYFGGYKHNNKEFKIRHIPTGEIYSTTLRKLAGDNIKTKLNIKGKKR